MTIWISHRGLCQEAVENTREAFDAAVATGFQHLETDLRATSDGHIVLCHDPSFSRLGGPSAEVELLTREQVASLRLNRGACPMFLDEFVSRYANCKFTFDVKPETARQVIEALGCAERFDPCSARYLFWKRSHQHLATERLGSLDCYAQELECYRAGVSLLLRAPCLGGFESAKTYSLPPRIGPIELYKNGYVTKMKNYGARCLAFLPESDRDIAAAIEAGFDEILLNVKIPKV